AVAGLAARVLVDLISTGPFEVVLDLSPDWRLISFAAALAIATGIVFGLAPAFQLRWQSASPVLTAPTRTTTRRSKLLPALVVFQIGLSLVLVAGGGLFVRSLINLQRLNPGFSTDDVFVVRLDRGVVPGPDQLLEVVRAVPGVLSAGIGTHTPL